MAKQSKKTIILAVRDFALPVPRTGSIEVNSGYGQIFAPAGSQAARGREIHLSVQKARQKEHAVYKSEVKLAEKFESESYIFSVSGRMDGFVDGVQPMIEEIKSSNQPQELAALLREDAHHPYCLQLATYAYILYLERLVAPRCHFVITDSKGEIVDEFDYAFSLDDYKKWLDLRLLELEKEVRSEENRRTRRQSVAQLLKFPFLKPRPFQQELVANLTADLKESANIIVQAPTGLGKTIGVMYPTLIDSLEKGERFIYVTPKNSQHTVAEDAVERLSQTIDGENVDLYSTTLNAKAKMCLKEEVICNPSYCQYARDYYTKVDQARLVDKLAQIRHLGAEQFKEIGEEYEVCPFELSLDTVQNADVVIGDYNYVFSPRNILGRLTFSLAKNNEKPNLVIDEAHNLPGRATDYYSRGLSSRELVELGSALSDLGFDIAVEGKKIVSNILFTISTVGRTYNQRDCKVTLSPLLFESHLADLQALAGRYVEGKRDSAKGEAKPDPKGKGKNRDALLSLLNLITDFVEALGYEGDEFLHLYIRSKLPDGGIEESLRVVCCDASAKLKLAHREFAHVVAFSATIKPFDYFSQLSGLHEEDLKTREYLSPFPPENRKLLIIPQVSTKFSDRAKNYGKIAEAINRIVAVRPGNYFVFFPSYGFLSSVYDKVKLLVPESMRLMRQESEMSAARAQELLGSLLAKDKPTLVFAVQGGVFAEGVDYPGDMIIGALIVGPGLPNYNFEREQIRQYYDARYGSGFDFAYVYPAMAKVIQAAGRVIRSDSDRGIIVLMDQRFIEKQYALAMPDDWFDKNASELVSRSIIQDVDKFWQSNREDEVKSALV
ncbi:MAG: ATP-dependent DNA helicase [Cyanobacteria bacterium REEB67]|nr:ATP-dependent DNA helicase [Cyanobacteria bacterium REEB67]